MHNLTEGARLVAVAEVPPTPYSATVIVLDRLGGRLVPCSGVTGALVLLGIALTASPVEAQGGSDGWSDGWSDTLAPDAVRGGRLLRRAMEHVLCALGAEECVPDLDSAVLGPEVEWEQALARLDRAVRYLPDDHDVLFFRALALARWERPVRGTVERRVDEAIAAFERVRELHPDVAPGVVAFELAILRTRQRDFVGATREYEIGAAATTLVPALPIVYSLDQAILVVGSLFLTPALEHMAANWAEVTMLAGDADRAVERFLVAVAAEGTSWPNGALARFGLALALERSGSHDAALDAVQEALDVEAPRSPDDARSATARALIGRFGSFAPLHAEGVFFEPECELRAYEALGNEALAEHATSVEGRRARLQAALASWRAFLSEGGREGLWAARAEESAAHLEALLAD